MITAVAFRLDVTRVASRYPSAGIKGQRHTGQRPITPQGGRFGDVSLWAKLRAGLRDKVITTDAWMPTLRSGAARLRKATP